MCLCYEHDVLLSVCSSVMLVDCDQTVQQKVEMAYDRTGSSPGCLHAEADQIVVSCDPEFYQSGMEESAVLHFGSIQRLACHVISTSAEFLFKILVILVSESLSQCSNAPSVSSLVVDEERFVCGQHFCSHYTHDPTMLETMPYVPSSIHPN